MENIQTIKGGIAEDQRGQIRFVNEFDMSLIQRFYIIKNVDTKFVRGWRAHRIERRWFYVLSGGFSFNFVKIDNWCSPDPNLLVTQEILLASDMKLLSVPSGYGTAFRALESNSELLVYSDYPISHAQFDDYTWALNYFVNLSL